jgi:hypothetical protein
VRCGEAHCIIVARRQVRHCWRLQRGAGEGVVIRADYSYQYIYRTTFLVVRVVCSYHNRKAAVERAVSACFAEVGKAAAQSWGNNFVTAEPPSCSRRCSSRQMVSGFTLAASRARWPIRFRRQ